MEECAYSESYNIYKMLKSKHVVMFTVVDIDVGSMIVICVSWAVVVCVRGGNLPFQRQTLGSPGPSTPPPRVRGPPSLVAPEPDRSGRAWRTDRNHTRPKSESLSRSPHTVPRKCKAGLI